MEPKYPQPDKSGNWNHDITIRTLDESDLYDGITVQSFGNSDCIYELRKISGKWMYRPIARINNRYRLPYIEKMGPGPWYQTGTSKWSETVCSISINPVIIREEKLKILGI